MFMLLWLLLTAAIGFSLVRARCRLCRRLYAVEAEDPFRGGRSAVIVRSVVSLDSTVMVAVTPARSGGGDGDGDGDGDGEAMLVVEGAGPAVLERLEEWQRSAESLIVAEHPSHGRVTLRDASARTAIAMSCLGAGL